MSKLPPGYGKNNTGTGANKLPPVTLNQTVAQGAVPATSTGQAETKTFVDTFFTKVPVVGERPSIVYNGDRMWAKVTLILETAGPVAVGNMADLTPVLSGKGQLLETDVPTIFYIAKGTVLYIAAAGINRVKRILEPVPWLETITGLVTSIAGGAAPSLAKRV